MSNLPKLLTKKLTVDGQDRNAPKLVLPLSCGKSKLNKTDGPLYLASYADALWARHAFLPECMTSQKSVCIGGYFISDLKIRGFASIQSIQLRQCGSENEYLVLSTELRRLCGHHKEF